MNKYSIKDNICSAVLGLMLGGALFYPMTLSWDKYDEQNPEPVAQMHIEKKTKEIIEPIPMNAHVDIPLCIPDEDIEDLQEEEYYDDLELLANLVEAEGGNQDMKGKRLVVDVVLNRVKSDKFPNTVREVIYQKGQFSTVTDGSLDRAGWSMKDDDYEAVRLEVEEGQIDTEILFFTYGQYNASGTPAYQHGDHFFSK